jgi:hypothetical protein
MNPYQVPNGQVYIPPRQPATYVYGVAEPYPTVTMYDVGERIGTGTGWSSDEIWMSNTKAEIYLDKSTSSSVDINKVKAQSSFTDSTIENSHDEK